MPRSYIDNNKFICYNLYEYISNIHQIYWYVNNLIIVCIIILLLIYDKYEIFMENGYYNQPIILMCRP